MAKTTSNKGKGAKLGSPRRRPRSPAAKRSARAKGRSKSGTSDRKKPEGNRDHGANHDARGRWAPGNRGNPAGRPKGSRNKVTEFCELLLDDQADRIVQAVIRKACAGHGTAMQLCVDRLMPARRDRHVAFAMPAIASLKDLSGAQEALLQQTSSGVLTPSEGATVAGLLEARRRVLETVQLEERLAAIEARLAVQGAMQ